MMLDHLRVELQNGRQILLPSEEWDQLRRARKFGHHVEGGLYTTEDLYGLKVAFEPAMIVMMLQVTEDGLHRAADLQDQFDEILERGHRPWE